jgi:hypothetical protein
MKKLLEEFFNDNTDFFMYGLVVFIIILICLEIGILLGADIIHFYTNH